MTDQEIDRIVGEHKGTLPFSAYRDVINSSQVDHVVRNGNRIDIWTRGGRHWNVAVHKD